jgi:hypothetical protein
MNQNRASEGAANGEGISHPALRLWAEAGCPAGRVAAVAKVELMPDGVGASESMVAELNSASILETIKVRESTLTTVMENIHQFRGSSRWGINE